MREKTGHATEIYCFQARVPSRAPLVRPVLSCVHVCSKAPATQGFTVVSSLRQASNLLIVMHPVVDSHLNCNNGSSIRIDQRLYFWKEHSHPSVYCSDVNYDVITMKQIASLEEYAFQLYRYTDK